MKYEIPTEIRSKPKLFGLEMKELIILLVSFFLVFTMLFDLVHSVFTVPYFTVSGALLLWIVIPSRNNPGMKNYMSFYLLFKHNRQTYHSLDSQKLLNENCFKKRDTGRIDRRYG
ncbi:DUF5592 family protein [Lederbergia citrea]|uniref:DUF5592 family protein n=1 Tax=Lederbergia citrea TaxID=2833581 RepID=UPI001BC96254|nr:hypothetical protein [Lederbergia citrea]